VPGVSEDAEGRLYQSTDDGGERYEHPDRRVPETEVGPNQRPSGAEDPEHELVEELDGEQPPDGGEGSAEATVSVHGRMVAAEHRRCP
jgi:hypothetical protein